MDISVLSSYQGTYTPIAGVKTYLYKSSGAYMGKTLTTDASGLVTYDLPEREYKVRADYMGYQWWSDPFTWTASDVVIPEGEVTVTVTDSGVPAQANVYVFTSGGSYMGLYSATDANGEVTVLLPADGGNSTNYNGYKFRADYSGTQTWSVPLIVTADVDNPVSLEVGVSAAISPRLRVPASPRHGSEEIQVASLYLLPGLLAQAANSAFADSNGEHLFFYHSDHLGTPLFLTDISGTVVWRGEYLPFGEVFSEDKDPDGDGVEVEQPFRFPGQYEDNETGLYYNYFRDYDPNIGRYTEADPIGLSGGVSLWGYVLQRPVSFTDIFGLEVIYNGNVIQNPDVVDALNRLDRDLPGTDIIVYGGDRYYDQDGDICSSTDDKLIKKSAKYSSHLSGVAVDFTLSNMSASKDLLYDYFDWVKDDYVDHPHIHGDLRDSVGGIICPSGSPREGYPFGAFGKGCE